MSRLIIPPTSLQADTQFSDAIPLINNNFDELGTAFKGFAVEDQLAFPSNANSIILTGGQLGVDYGNIYSSNATDDIVFAAPRLSVFIDPPIVTDPNATTYDVNYLYPTGAALTPGQLRVIIGTYIGISAYTGSSTFNGSDGKTYYYRNYVSVSVRNADSATHGYFLLINQSVYSSGRNQYR